MRTLTTRRPSGRERRGYLCAQPCAPVSSQPWVIGHPATPRAGQGRRARSIKLRKRTAWALRAPKLVKRGAERELERRETKDQVGHVGLGRARTPEPPGAAGVGEGAGRTGKRGDRELTEEDVLGIAAPDLVVAVLVDEGGGARGVTRHHVEAGLG